MDDIKDLFFYDERPANLHCRQAEVVEYLFLDRPRDMHFNASPVGKPESAWSEFTKQNVFLPLLDPRREMHKMYQPLRGFS